MKSIQTKIVVLIMMVVILCSGVVGGLSVWRLKTVSDQNSAQIMNLSCREEGKKIDALLNRSQIFAGQAPEVFRLGRYYEANQVLLPEKILTINGSTEPAILAGMDVVMIPGDEGNFKITTKADLERFQTRREK